MKKILTFALCMLMSAGSANAAVRDGNAASRAKSGPQRATTSEKGITARTSVLSPRKQNNTLNTSRGTSSQKPGQNISARTTTSSSTATTRTTSPGRSITQISSRSTNPTPVVARTATATSISETRTGAAYEQCKNAYFTCMDQFCTLKNDDYRRCSCSNRVYNLTETRKTLQEAGEKLTVFTENLNVVGMTAAQANAMKTASDGENALTSDTSASKALLQAIMNSIRGTDSNVGGKYSDLNSINISFDTANAFGMTDAGQAIAAYNGQNLYSAVYPQCRNAVKADCNDASLQRAVTAYLMAIEQDCNTVETAIVDKQKQMKSAIREGSAMLDLARVENRQKHNSDDIASCMANVENAILSEEVCGAGYHKCLDNGEFIDITTGAPIAGVANFYELEQLLTFPKGVDATDQQLTKVNSNRTFVQNFEKRVKKFAQPALDKCTEQADVVWAEYLDKAMLDIYYAQKAKVAEIKQGCFDFVSACYMNGDTSITTAMKELTGDSSIIVQPYRVVLNDKLCADYVNSCNNMFDGNIVQQYIEKRTDTDTLTACRAIVKQCFDKYGGNRYENFYYPYSGLFSQGGNAPDWFTLYEINDKGTLTVTYDNGETRKASYKSECAKQLETIDACNNQQLIEQAFGGFDKIKAKSETDTSQGVIWLADANNSYESVYGLINTQEITTTAGKSTHTNAIKHRYLRPTGVATEIYNQIIDTLTTQCTNVQGRFVEHQFIRPNVYDKDDPCIANFTTEGIYKELISTYGIGTNENMCPRDYSLNVDTLSWGACLCWENGGRRSKWGKSAKCLPILPVNIEMDDKDCPSDATALTIKNINTVVTNGKIINATANHSIDNWCTVPQKFIKSTYKNRVCQNSDCTGSTNLPEGM